MVKLIDIAKKAGVSVATVSYVLNDSRAVSPILRKKVLSAAKELGYKKNWAAAALRKGTLDHIALLLPDLSNLWYSQFVHNFTIIAQQNNLWVSIFNAANHAQNEEKILSKISQMRLKACVWVPFTDRYPIGKLSSPLILVDRDLKGLQSLSFDNYEGGKLQAQHILKQSHKKILLLYNTHIGSAVHNRYLGAIDVLDKAHSDYIAIKHPHQYELLAEVKKIIKNKEVDNIICATDALAIGCLNYANHKGICVPDELSIMGYDDHPLASLTYPPLTTIHQDYNMLVERIMAILLSDDIQKQFDRSKQSSIPVQLIERGSTR